MCERCDQLTEEVAYLKSEMGLSFAETEISALRQAFRLSPAQARVVLALYRAKGRVLTPPQLLDALPVRGGGDDERDPHMPSVLVHRIRGRIGREHVNNAWGAGYSLTPEGLLLIGLALGEAERPVSGPELKGLSERPGEEFRGLTAHVAGILAHRDGDGGTQTAVMLRRIADRLTGQPRVAP